MHTFIKNLLNGQSVEWKTLGEVAELKRGRVMSKEYLADNKGDYPVYSSQTANNGEIGKINTFDFEGEFVTWTTDGANAGTVFYRNGKFSITNVCGLVILNDLNQLNHKFIYYWLCIEAKKYVYSGMGNPKLMSNQMEKVKIPIPPLSVQQKIAQILDAFTAITAELTAEYTLRTRQYQYYRDKLLSVGELNKVGFEWKTLREVAEYSKSRIFFQDLDETNYIGVDNLLQNKKGKTLSNHIPEKGNITAYFENDILIGNIRPYLKKIWQANNNGGASGDVLVIHLTDDSVNSRYLYQVLADDKFFDYSMKYAKGAKMPRGDKESILKYPIPIPPLSEQNRIVAILDKFETLTNSITDGLPKEISLRQKQYEYYRQVLLDFAEPVL